MSYTGSPNRQPANPTGGLVWYFAYGSNMSREKFTGSRGIVPLQTARVRVPGWTLAFNIPGMPYSEPAFTSILPREGGTGVGSSVGCSYWFSEKQQGLVPDVLGVAYLITQEQHIQVLASEGGGIAYDDIEVLGVPVGIEDTDITGPAVTLRTLGAAMQRNLFPKPSLRYMNIIITGSRELKMPRDYQQYLDSVQVYESPRNWRGKMGATIFLTVWGPIMSLMEKITYATMNKDGYAPKWVILLVRSVVMILWFTHDAFFAPVFGRGDGCTELICCPK